MKYLLVGVSLRSLSVPRTSCSHNSKIKPISSYSFVLIEGSLLIFLGVHRISLKNRYKESIRTQIYLHSIISTSLNGDYLMESPPNWEPIMPAYSI